MKTAVIKAPYKIDILDTKIPAIKDNEVLVKVAYAGLCGTDVDIYQNKAAFKVDFPIICGHEWSGIVEKVGKDTNFLKEGDKVVGEPTVGCGKCIYCMNGYYTKCLNMHGVGTSNPVDGAFREYTVMPEINMIKIPDGVSLLEASITEPCVLAAYALEKEIGINPGDIVIVAGTGAIGIFNAQYAKLMGAGMVILMGRNGKKLKIIKDIGVDYVINIKEENLFKRIEQITGDNGVNVGIEASGNVDALNDILTLVSRFGRVSIPGSYSEPLKQLDLGMCSQKGLLIRFLSSTGGAEFFKKVLWLIKLKKINTRKLITSIFNLDDLEKAINTKLSPNDDIKTVIKINKDLVE